MTRLQLGDIEPGRGKKLRRLQPWWVGAMRRARAANRLHRQPKTASGGGGARRKVALHKGVPGRRSMVKASFRRNRHNGAWARHARYLARERAQDAKERGVGFDSTARRTRHRGYRAGLGEGRRAHVVIHHLARRRETNRSAATFTKAGRGHGARSWAPGWNGSRSITTTPITTTFT